MRLAKKIYRALTKFVIKNEPIRGLLVKLLREMRRIKAEAKVGIPKKKHSMEKKTRFSGHRLRKLDSLVGTIYYVFPKIRMFLSETHKSIQTAEKEWSKATWRRGRVPFNKRHSRKEAPKDKAPLT